MANRKPPYTHRQMAELLFKTTQSSHWPGYFNTRKSDQFEWH
jgi:hypothetical protein